MSNKILNSIVAASLFMSMSSTVFAADKYSGEMKNGVAHGQGTKYFGDGSVYIGFFRNGEMTGSGSLTLRDGRVYSGHFNKGVFGDKKSGKIRYLDGSYEEGIFDNWKLNGEGYQSLGNGEVRKGRFVNGVLNGKGEVRWPSGQNYVGEFVNGVFNGQGQYTELDERYNKIFSEGEFKDGALNGKGKRIFPGIYEYEGEFKDGLFEGVGRLAYTDGVVAEGEFKHGMLNGKAVYESPNKFKYIGVFVDDETLEDGIVIKDEATKIVTVAGRLDKGQAKVDYPTDAEVVFKDKNMKYEGKVDRSHNLLDGELIFDDEYTYKGLFKNNRPTAQGELKYKDLKYSGEYDKSFKPHGKGRLTFSADKIYEGAVEGFEPHGKGKLIFSEAEYIVGDFDNFNIKNCSYKSSEKSIMSESCNDEKVFNGKAAIFYTNGEFYIGDLENSNKIGKSYLRKNYSASKYYVGYAENDEPKGLGKLYDTNASFIEGEFNTIETIYKKKEFRLIFANEEVSVYYNKPGDKMIEALYIFKADNPTEEFANETYVRYQSKCNKSFLLAQQRKRNEQWTTVKETVDLDSDLNKNLYKTMCK